MRFLRLFPLLCLALGEECSETSDKSSLLQTKTLAGEEAQLSKSLILAPRTLQYPLFRRRHRKGLLPYVYIRINVAVDDSNRDNVLTKLREQQTEFLLGFFFVPLFFGIPYKANLRILKTTSTLVQFQVGFIPDLRFKFGVVDPKATLRATVWKLDRILRGPDESNQVRIRYVGGVVGGFFFNNSLLVQDANVSFGKPVLWHVKQDSAAPWASFFSIWILWTLWTWKHQLPACQHQHSRQRFREPKEPTGPIFDAIAGNTSGWISLIANSSDPDTRGLPFAVSETEDMALVSELLFRDQFPRDNATIVNALVVEFQQCQRRFYKEEQAGYNQRILDWLSQQPATAGLKYTVTTDISLVWTVA